MIEINDIGPIAADHIFNFLSKKDNQNLIRKLLRAGIELEEVQVQSKNLFSYLFLLIPLFLITGPALPDIVITLGVIFGIFYVVFT